MTEKEKAMLQETYTNLLTKRFRFLNGRDEYPYVSLKAIPTYAKVDSKRPYPTYDGILLMFNSEVRGYKTNIYSTLEEWEQWFKDKINFRVKPDQKPFPLTNRKVIMEKYVKKSISWVYNLDQLELIGEKKEEVYHNTALSLTTSTNPFDGIEKLETLIKCEKWSNLIEFWSDESCYDIRQDKIILGGKKDADKRPARFYEDLLHTMAHSTGKESQENRFTEENGWGVADHFYHKEELVAELSAMYVAARCGLEKHVNSFNYGICSSWVDMLETEPDFVWVLLERVASAILWMTEGILTANNHKQFECLSL